MARTMWQRRTGWRRTPGAASRDGLCAIPLEGSHGIRRGKVAPPWLGESHGGANLIELLLLAADPIVVAI